MATITESFNKANADTLGPDLSWTEDAGDFDVVSNKAQDASAGLTHAWARADSDLDSDDHYVEAVLNTSANDSFHGLMCRKDSTSTSTYYMFQFDCGSNLVRVFKRVSGSFTSLANLSATINPSTNYTVKLQVSGSDIECFVDGGSVGTTSDATITGNLRCGLVGFYVTGGTVCTWDDFEAADLGGGPTVEEGVGVGTGTATVTGTGRSFAHVVGVSSAVASVAGVGANANAGERETVGTSTGQASVVGVGGKDHFSTGTAAGVASVSGVGQSEVLTVGNSAGVASVVGVGEAVIAGQAVGTASGIATVSGVASSIAEAVGTSSGASDASGVNPQVVVTQRLVVGAGGELTWEDHVKAIHEMRMLEGQVKEKKKELKRVEKQIKVAEKKFKFEKAEGILANLHRLEIRKDELENKIEALEVDLEPLMMAIEKFEIEEDDQEFMMMQ
jgi:hypothetical protein